MTTDSSTIAGDSAILIKNEAARRVNVERPLTRSSGISREGLAMQATRTARKEHLTDWTYARQVLLRLHAGAELDGDCWLWTRSRTPDGYGQISIKRAMVGCHQVAYQIYIGDVPDGLQLDHLCRRRACCNPWHLEPVTSGENTRRGVKGVNPRSLVPHCPQGHDYDERNTYRHPATGARTCRRCRADREAAKHVPAPVGECPRCREPAASSRATYCLSCQPPDTAWARARRRRLRAQVSA